MMKGMASASTVAWIMYQKYCNSVPLYRQEKDWERLYGLKIPRSTFANWVIDNADAFLKPVYDHMHRLLVSRDFLMGDETPLQVLHEPDRRAQTKSYMWVFRTGEDGVLPSSCITIPRPGPAITHAGFWVIIPGISCATALAVITACQMQSGVHAGHIYAGISWTRSQKERKMTTPSLPCRASCTSKSSSFWREASGKRTKARMLSEMREIRRNVLSWTLSLRGLTARNL